MNHCLNCGQANDSGAHFCRFCGTKASFVPQPSPARQHNEIPPAPRPYAWKTDEFNVNDALGAKTADMFNQKTSHQGNNRNVQPFNPGYQPQHGLYADNANYRCPHCGTQNPPTVQRKISTAGWIVFAALLIFFFPLFWIGLLIKDNVRVCSVCRYQID